VKVKELDGFNEVAELVTVTTLPINCTLLIDGREPVPERFTCPLTVTGVAPPPIVKLATVRLPLFTVPEAVGLNTAFRVIVQLPPGAMEAVRQGPTGTSAGASANTPAGEKERLVLAIGSMDR
jgi:hypothetical protein